MRLSIRNKLVGLGLLAALTLLGAGSSQVGRAQDSARGGGSESHAGKIEGTWRVRVTLRNCQTGDALRTFPAMLTFAQGGTLTGTTTAFSPALRSPDHGVWEQTGRRTYSAVTDAFIFNTAGAWVATQRITQAIKFGGDPDEFNSDAKVEFFDTGGNLTSAGCATAVADRF